MEHKAFGVHFTCGPEEGSTLWLLESEIVAHLKGASSLDVEMFWKSWYLVCSSGLILGVADRIGWQTLHAWKPCHLQRFG